MGFLLCVLFSATKYSVKPRCRLSRLFWSDCSLRLSRDPKHLVPSHAPLLGVPRTRGLRHKREAGSYVPRRILASMNHRSPKPRYSSSQPKCSLCKSHAHAMRFSLLAASVESNRGSGVLRTRHRFNRSASQHTPTVGSGSTPPLVVLLAGEPQQFHLRLLKVESLAAQLPGQRRSPRAVQWAVVVVEPHGDVASASQ
jgi:hypothetical protein